MPNDSDPGTPCDWLARAKSSLAHAQSSGNKDVLWEDLCYDAQQAAEKAVKAVFRHNGKTFPYIHDLQELFRILKSQGIVVPDAIREAERLTEYAVDARYPGDYEQLTEDDHREAIVLAARVVTWAADLIVES